MNKLNLDFSSALNTYNYSKNGSEMNRSICDEMEAADNGSNGKSPLETNILDVTQNPSMQPSEKNSISVSIS